MLARRVRLLSLVVLGIALILAGCSGSHTPGSLGSLTGGGGGTGGESDTGVATLTINWPVRTRDITAPVAANSVLVGVIRTDTQAVLINQVAVRPTNGATFSSITLSQLPLTTLQIGVVAYPNSDGTGTPQASGTTQFTLSSQTQSTDLKFAFSSTIDHLVANVSKTKIGIGATADLSITAFDSAGDIIITEPTSLVWTAVNSTVAAIVPTSMGFQVVGLNVGASALVVTDSESGKTAQTNVTVGFPLTATVSTQGTRGAVAFSVNEPDDTGLIQSLSNTQFQWISAPNGLYSPVTLTGTPVTLFAPSTYGDRQFVNWVQDGVNVGTNSQITLDPTVLTNTSITAVYQTRSADSGGQYQPNEIGNIDPSSGQPTVAVQWPLTQAIKVSFLTSDLYTDNLKQQAVAGFNYWTSISGGLLEYTILPNDDPADADIVVAFTTAENPNPLPTQYLPAGTTPYSLPLTTNPKIAGLTFYVSQDNVGIGQRVILMFANRFTAPVWASVACHEMGHAMGIFGHSANSADLMYPYITIVNNSEVFNGLPIEDDVNTVFTLYNFSSAETRKAGLHRTGAASGARGAKAHTGKVVVTEIP